MSKSDPSFQLLDPDPDARFIVKQKPDFSDMPISDTMARVRAFLPIMKQANEDLSQRVLENPNSAGFEFVQIEENVDSANSDEEYDSEESEQEEEQHEGEEKKVIQMDLFVVPDDSEDEEGREVTLDGRRAVAAEENDSEGEDMLDEEGRPLPTIQRHIKEVSKVRKPKIEVLASEQSTNEDQED